MTFEELKKKLKQAQNIKISFQELENNEFIATIKGIINSMDKKKRITNEDLLNIMTTRFDKVESRLDNLENDMKILKREATKHGWDLNHDNNF